MPLLQQEIPKHLRAVPALDVSDVVTTDPMAGAWVRIGAWGLRPRAVSEGEASDLLVRTVLVNTRDVQKLFKSVKWTGKALAIGAPGGVVQHSGRRRAYRYRPFYHQQVVGVSVEPLVFVVETAGDANLELNQDLWLFLGLVPQRVGPWTEWFDPSAARIVLRHGLAADGGAEVVEVEREHLRRYLRERQMALVWAWFEDRHQPSLAEFAASAPSGEHVIDAADGSARAFVDANALLSPVPMKEQGFRLAVHYWTAVLPPALDLEEPWAPAPPFDVANFLLPTRAGDLAPGRWSSFAGKKHAKFGGSDGEYMERVYFRQEVLQKYQGLPGVRIGDDGSVRCGGAWSLCRGVFRVGNTLVS